MQAHNLKRRVENKTSARVGRGGKRGKTAGRGTKGQKARAGRKIRPEIRDVIKRYPKLRGRGKNSFLSIQTKPTVVTLSTIETKFTGAEVNPKTLVEAGIVSMYKGLMPKIKIVGNGEFAKKVTVSGCLVSEGAKGIIEKAGGSVTK